LIVAAAHSSAAIVATKVAYCLLFVVAIFSTPLSVRAQQPAPRIVFAPALNVVQSFRVTYRISYAPVTSTDTPQDWLGIAYRLTATAIAREQDGYRLRLLVSEVQRLDPPGGMDMVAAAALMLDGLNIEMHVDARGLLKEVVDWSNLQHTLRKRADAMGDQFAGIGHSVVDNRTAQQAVWVLFPAIAAMNGARNYLDLAEHAGASTVSWFGSPIDVTIEPANADGTVAMSWASPAGAGARWKSKGECHFSPGRFCCATDGDCQGRVATGPVDHED
jgi:hypothetical protein